LYGSKEEMWLQIPRVDLTGKSMKQPMGTQHKVHNRAFTSGWVGGLDNRGTNSFLSISETLKSIQPRTIKDVSSVSYFTLISNSEKK